MTKVSLAANEHDRYVGAKVFHLRNPLCEGGGSISILVLGMQY
jgi:hypothetical protein